MRGVTKRRIMFSVAGFLLALSLFGAAPVAAVGDTGRGTVDNVTPGTSGDPHDRLVKSDGGDHTLIPDLGRVQSNLFTGATDITAWDLIIRYGDPNSGLNSDRGITGYNRPADPTRGTDVTLRN